MNFKKEDLKVLSRSKAKELKNQLLNQSKKCPLCKRDFENPVLDHKHARKSDEIGADGAGLVRGVICSTCNVFLGKLENNYKRFKIPNLPDFLRNAADYLESEPLPFIHHTESKKLKVKFSKSLYNKLMKLIAGDKKIPIQEVKMKHPYNPYLTKKFEALLTKYGLED